MDRDGFIFYRGFYNCLKGLSIEERDRLSMAIFAYGLDGIEPELDGYLLSMFELMRPQIDANNRRYFNGKKGGAPLGNQNAKKKLDIGENGEKQLKQPVVDLETTKNNQKQPKDKEKEKEKEKEKGYGEKQDTQITLDANASRGIVEKKSVVGEDKDKYEANGMKLSDKLSELGLEDEIIGLAITYNSCKKGKKLDKFKDAQLKIRVDKLRRCGFNTIEGMKQVLENSIAGGYQGIFELKQKPNIKPKPIEEGKVVNVNGANIFF